MTEYAIPQWKLPQKQPRGFRLNNPGNIRHGDKWQGLAAEQPDREFCAFADPRYGVRAIVIILRSYARRGINTVREIVTAWAPPNGQRPDGTRYTQQTDAYIAHVAQLTGMRADQVDRAAVDLGDYAQVHALVSAIIRHECGQGPRDTINSWYADEVIDGGLLLAGIQRPPKPFAKSETVQGAAVSGAAGLVATGTVLVESAREAKALVEPGTVVATVLALLIVAGVALTIRGRLRTRRVTGR